MSVCACLVAGDETDLYSGYEILDACVGFIYFYLHDHSETTKADSGGEIDGGAFLLDLE